MSTWSVEARLAVGLTIAGLGLMSAKALAQGVSPPGRPQFLSAPLHAPEQVQQRIQGWLTFAVNQGKPSGGDPAAPEPASASFAGLSQTGSAPVDALASNTTYQGEPALTVTPDLLLVGGYNSIDPGKCSATLANCAPGATIADASTSTWRTSRIPIAGNLLGFDPSTAADSANKV